MSGSRAASISRASASHNEGSTSRSRGDVVVNPYAPSSPGIVSDVSTSDDSQDELDPGDGSRVNISLMDEHADGDEDDELGETATLGEDNPEVKCMWEDCGEMFTNLSDFIRHLQDQHVGIHRAKYACEWSGCPRKGKPQTSRFALLSHLRSHTGEKPFTCPRPECDKSFTRSDALAKHMRVQHNINPVTSRGKGSATAQAQLGMYGRGKNRGGAEGFEEDEWADKANKSNDVLADELLELAEGDANGSFAEVEQSLMTHGSKSQFFTYDYLFGAGARALANLNVPHATANGKGAAVEADLGIERDTEYNGGLSANDGVRDEQAIARVEEDMAKVLEAGRRDWIAREQEHAKERPDVETLASKRDQIDYLSDDEIDDSRTYKRARRSSTRHAQRQAQNVTDIANLKRLYIVEKAKLRYVLQENRRMHAALQSLREDEQHLMTATRGALERALEREFGNDVAAIFSPPPSPKVTR